MNYFQFYDLPTSFLLDEAELKRRFYERSKRLHPDFYTLEPEEKQLEALELSTYNNQAYKTLSDFDARMKYALELNGLMPEEGKAALPQSFLMEMMEINEEVMEFELEPELEEERLAGVLSKVEAMERALLEEVTPTLSAFGENPDGVDLQPVVEYYFKKKYLLRIKENLGKFASPK